MDVENSYKISWKDADDENLIILIQQNPTLWDNKRGDYRDAVKKQRILMQISLNFPGSTPIDIEKRFTAIKEKLRREKKKEKLNSRSGAAASTCKQWHLMPSLGFLSNILTPRLTICNDSRPGSTSLDSTNQYSPLSSNPPSPISPQSPIVLTTPTTDKKCPSRSLKSTQTLMADFFQKSIETMGRFADSAANVTAQPLSAAPHPAIVPEEKRASHFKVLKLEYWKNTETNLSMISSKYSGNIN